MILYHATPVANLTAILREGLRPDAPGLGAGSARVHLHVDQAACRGFIERLYDLPVAVLAVNAEGLVLLSGDDDDEDEFAVAGTISPDRLRVQP